ncbi:DUF6252 family protein [Xanthomarina sp. F2636L]|uniref:DUF6252 family protein n=1 Tax=Xanthomarina sp. F2636L TaxID=2996018 RepID=UPI00225E040E|nr:DUF6252 family protein [Xanthomarina sp. F2636L]MCX7550978.1 DUF6252 family protein [Xanthomarina sp. F2636L]
MKKLFVFALAIFTLVSCGDEIEFNSPAMQGKKDGSTWKAVSYRAYINENGKSIITGNNNYETINLQVSSFSVGTYLLGENDTNEAVLISSTLEEYSTNNLPDQDIELYPPDGIIEITEFNQINNSISGKFWFNAYSVSGTKTVNFSQGIFYNIPIPFSSGPGLMSCDEAVAATAVAAQLYNTTNPGDANYSTACNAYKTALIDQQIACGDDSGVLQGIIDVLNCDATESDYWPRAINNSWTYNTMASGEQTYTITGTEIFDSLEYYAFDDLYGAPSWLRKSGPNYYVRAEMSGSVPGYQFSATPYTVNMIKDDAIVGETWESNVSYTISYTPEPGQPNIPDTLVDAVYAFEMIGRDLSRTVEGVNYNNVIHIELITTGAGVEVTTQYYYAKDVGLIEYITDEGANTLSSYVLN